MPEFLQLIPPAEALSRWFSALGEPQVAAEQIETAISIGRVTAEDILAPQPLPEFARSTVDGYAVCAADTFGANEGLPAYFSLAGEVATGCQPDFALRPGQAALIHTGGMLPANADAVVMVELTQVTRPGEVEVLRPVAPLENLIRVGEDVEAGQCVIPAGSRLRPADIGGLMALGVQTVTVARRPRIAIISTGDEVVPATTKPAPGQVRDVNSHSLGALIEENGGQAAGYGIVADDANALRIALIEALDQCDGVLITAGSSASARDLTARVINEAGQPGVIVHGVNVRPGKPTILAVCNRKPVIGLPGNPVSALVIAWLFAIPLLERLQRLGRPRLRSQVRARLNLNLASLAGREDWLPVKLVSSPDGIVADPIFFKSNLIFNLAKADGLLYIPADLTGLSAGDEAVVYLL